MKGADSARNDIAVSTPAPATPEIVYVEKLVPDTESIVLYTYYEARYDSLKAKYDSIGNDWQSKQEIEQYLSNITLLSYGGDCSDRAFTLQKHALNNGKRLNVEVLTDKELGVYYRVNSNDYHLICSAVVPSERMIYYIEPVTMKVWAGATWND